MQSRKRIRIPRVRGRFLAVWLCACLLLTMAAAPAFTAQRTIFAGGNHIMVIDEPTMSVVAQIPVQKQIHQLVVDQARERIYAAHSGGVEIFHARSYASLGCYHEDPARRLTLSADGNTLYALTHPMLVNDDGQRYAGEYAIQIIDLEQGKLSGSINLGYEIFDAVVDPVHGKVFAMKRFDRSLSVHSLAEGTRLATVNVASDFDPMKVNLLHFIARSPDGQHLYVPQHGASACVFDVDSQSGASRPIDLGGEYFIRDSQVSPDGRSLFLLTADQLLVVDTAGRRLAGAASLDEVYIGLDLSADGSRIYLSNPLHGDGSAGNLLLLDARSLKAIGLVETPGMSLFTAAAFERD